jgi:hypothetical protein
MLVLRHDQSPIEQIADMSQDFPRRPRSRSRAKLRKILRDPGKRLSSAISESSECVSKQVLGGFSRHETKIPQFTAREFVRIVNH